MATLFNKDSGLDELVAGPGETLVQDPETGLPVITKVVDGAAVMPPTNPVPPRPPVPPSNPTQGESPGPAGNLQS